MDSFHEVHGRKVGEFFFVKSQLRRSTCGITIYEKNAPVKGRFIHFSEDSLIIAVPFCVLGRNRTCISAFGGRCLIHYTTRTV